MEAPEQQNNLTPQTDEAARLRQIPKLTNTEARRIIVDSILALQDTGVDHEGSLQAWWPFTDSPITRRIPQTTRCQSNNWVSMVKDTRDVSAFAVVNQHCLEFRDQCFVRKCSATLKVADVRFNHNIFHTRILLKPSSVSVFRNKNSVMGWLRLPCGFVSDCGGHKRERICVVGTS
jgi:hypothetical protein